MNLQKAQLEGATLREAQLQDANLRGTWLLDAELSEADLQEANLESATLPRALQQGANLKGLESLKLPTGEVEKNHPVSNRQNLVSGNPLNSVKTFLTSYWRRPVSAFLLPILGWVWQTFVQGK